MNKFLSQPYFQLYPKSNSFKSGNKNDGLTCYKELQNFKNELDIIFGQVVNSLNFDQIKKLQNFLDREILQIVFNYLHTKYNNNIINFIAIN